ncbi:MAG: hypothetical protein ACK4TJ_00805 [Tabrizicola sp.]
MRPFMLLLALAAGESRAEPDSLESMRRAQELGTILGSETLCDLAIDTTAVQAWISDKVSPDDMTFAGNLQMMIAGAQLRQQEMSEAARVAYCTAITQSARTAGLIR